MITNGVTWTDERIEQLTKLWADGWSASEIAIRLDCGLTRNAVIGKVRRLGLPFRMPADWRENHTKEMRGTAGPRKPREPRERKPREPKPVVTPRVTYRRTDDENHAALVKGKDMLDPREVPFEQRKTFMELENHHCRWPYGHPGTEGFFFCGAPADVLGHRPYCDGHAAVAIPQNSGTTGSQWHKYRSRRMLIPTATTIGALAVEAA